MPLTAETDRQERSGLVALLWNLRDLELDAILVWTLVCDTSSQRAVSLAGLAQTLGHLDRGVSCSCSSHQKSLGYYQHAEHAALVYAATHGARG